MDAVSSELGWTSYRTGTFDSWRGPVHTAKEDYVAEEVPVVLVYNTIPHVVMLATPLNLEDFALGFSLTEEIIGHPSELQSIRVVQRSKGVEVRMTIPEARFEKLHGKGKKHDRQNRLRFVRSHYVGTSHPPPASCRPRFSA